MRIVAGVIGAVIGYFATGGTGIGAAYGWSIGYGVGSVLFPEAGPNIQGPRLSDLRVQDSTYGQPINSLYGGAVRISGMVVWATPLEERSKTSSQGGKGGGGSEVTTYSYYANCAVALCEGPVARVQKVWADGKLIYDLAGGNIAMGKYFRVYLGSETQMPDPFIESHEGVGSTPAYRGLCYVVFEGFPLADYANRIPQFSFEVVKTGVGTFTTTKIGSWTNETLLGSFFSAPYLLGGTVPVVSWGYYYGYTGVDWADIVPNAGTSVHPTTYTSPWDFSLGGSPGGFPLVGYADEPGALIGVNGSGYLAWLAADGTLTQTTIPQLTIVNVQSSFCKEGDIIWVSALYAIGSYHIYRYDLRTASVTYPAKEVTDIIYGGGSGTDQLTVSTDIAPFAIIGVSADYLYVTNFITHGLERRDKVTLEYIETVATNTTLMAPTTGYVLSDDIVYVASGGINKVNTTTGELTYLSVPHSSGIVTLMALAEDVFIWTDSVLGDTVNLYFSVSSGIAQVPLSQVVTEICERVGLSAADIDVSQLASDMVDGYVVARRTTARGLLEPLAATYNFDATESDHIIKFVKRGAASIRTIPADDLAAYDSGDEPPATVAGQRLNDLEMPVQVDLSYMRRASDYQNSTQTARRPTAPGDNVVSLEFPLVLADDVAKSAAETQLAQAWLARQKESWQTTRKHIDLEPCDVVTLPLADGWTPVRITKKDESRNGLIKWEGEVYDESTYSGFDTSTYGGLTGQVITGLPPGIYPTSMGLLLDLPALRDQDSDTGYYWAASGSGTITWSGAALFESYNSDSNYTQLASMTTAATIGTVSNTLGSGPTGIFDEGNVITVVLNTSATLSSVTRESVLNGSNAALVGKEIIQFRTATLTAPNTYQLSGLLRGRKGTEWAVGSHQANEIFLFLQPVGITRIAEQVSNLNLTKPFKTVTFGQALTDVSPVNFTPKGNALKPYSPVQLAGGRDADGNVLLRWRRRTRIAGELRDGFEVALNESTEAYDIEVWNSGYTTLKRTFSNVSSANLTYLASDQVTDFGAPQAKVYVKIYQLSAVVGRGDELKGAI